MLKLALAILIAALMPVAGNTSSAQSPSSPPQPGLENRQLADFVGTWRDEAVFQPSPIGPSGKMSLSETCDWFPGGFSLVCNTDTTGSMGSIKTHTIISYDPETKLYTHSELNNYGLWASSTGTYSAGVWTFTRESKTAGKMIKVRSTIKLPTADTALMTSELSVDEGAWSPLMTLKGNRVKQDATSFEEKPERRMIGLSSVPDVVQVDPQHHRVIFENSHIRVIEARDKPGDTTEMHHHPAYISYVDGPVKAQITLATGGRIMSGPSHEVLCSPPTMHSTENIGTTNTHEVLVEFKDFDPCDDENTGAPETKRSNAITSAQAESSVIASVVKNERAAFEAVKNRDKKTYAELMANEMIVISADEGMLDRNATLKSFDSENLASYSLNNIKGVFVDSNVILLTYELHIKTSLAGNPHEGDFLVSSLWANRNGAWKNVLYQETVNSAAGKKAAAGLLFDRRKTGN